MTEKLLTGTLSLNTTNQPLLHSIYQWFKKFVQQNKNLEIGQAILEDTQCSWKSWDQNTLNVCVKQIQNVLKWKKGQFSPLQHRCLSLIDWLKIAEGIWTGHIIALYDFYDLPLDKRIKSFYFFTHQFQVPLVHSMQVPLLRLCLQHPISRMKNRDWWSCYMYNLVKMMTHISLTLRKETTFTCKSFISVCTIII